MRPALHSCHYVQVDMLNARTHGLQAHEHHELLLVVQGGYRARVGTRPVTCRAGEFLLHPAGTVHQPSNPPDRSLTLIVLAWTGPAPPTIIRPQADQGGRLRQLLDLLCDTPDAAGDLRQHLLMTVLAEAAWQRQGTTPTDVVDRIRDLLDGFPQLDLTLSDLCLRYGLGRTTLVRIFRTRTGLAPMRYLQRSRARHAALLLQDPGRTGTAVAAQVGLRTVAALSRLLARSGLGSIRALRCRRRH
jgi:AraC-like DNA-binding protein